MNIKNSFFIVALALFWVIQSNAQTGQEFDSRSGIHEYYDNNWSIGAGFNIVDDSGKTVGGIVDPGKYWNFSVPFYVSGEYYLNNKFSFTAMLSWNKYIEGKQIDEGILLGEEPIYFAADLGAKYYFRDLLQSYVFDPYVFLGFGYTSIGAYQTDPIDYQLKEIRNVPESGRMTVNFGVGFNYWFSPNWGVNLNLAGKLGIDSGTWSTSQKQYAFGVVYFFSK